MYRSKNWTKICFTERNGPSKWVIKPTMYFIATVFAQSIYFFSPSLNSRASKVGQKREI